MGHLTNFVAKTVRDLNADSVMTGTDAIQYLRDEVGMMGKDRDGELTVFGAPVFSTVLCRPGTVVFMKGGEEVGRIENLRRV